ncbi:FecR family protein [Robertkochia solimangrovi]|uniref:FecR family protein n=1 Tax=Robertkochia solimangrovi TaxID=2213046 RepID=UPI00117D294D|nr:FecR domain-containing protein [Robertkochia solimangrovi]TRZ41305.1 hypothetical protein DMZ48_17910 [Robertkochia solimangrovi]
MEDLIQKYIDDTLSKEEEQRLRLWLSNPENRQIFDKILKEDFDLHFAINERDTGEAYLRLLKRMERTPFQREKKSDSRLGWLKYVAVFIGIIGLGYLIKLNNPFETTIIPAKTESITLELEDGSIEILDETGNRQFTNAKGEVIGKQEADRLTYQSGSSNDKLAYNTLKVPFGRKFDLYLSDGTRVVLNSGSAIRYPVKFLSGDRREVTLIGEAYFDVAKNESAPFSVSTEELKVTVLGTEFNVTSYPEDTNVDVVLVEGSVALSAFDGASRAMLEPGMKGALNKTSAENSIIVSQVNTAVYTSWMTGRLIFRDMPFRNIARKLERQYNVKIVIEDEALSYEPFSGTLDHEDLEKVLSYFKDLYQMNYRIENEIIYISQPKN